MIELCQGPCEVWIPQLIHSMGRGKPKMIFADPPDNIGLGYSTYKDKLDDDEYVQKLESWTDLFLEHTSILWMSFNAKWTAEMGHIAYQHKRLGLELKPCIQTFTFGQHNKSDLGNNHRPLWRLKHEGATIYPDQIRVPSWRQLNGDKRADPRGRVPGDCIKAEHVNQDTLPLPNLSIEDIQRFLEKIDIKSDNECWEWTANTRKGYGRFRVRDHLYVATRLIWRLVHGSDPIGQLLLHTCDNPSCCNPNHLFLGSHADNNRDKESKGRGRHPKGSNNGLSKLTEEQVIEIFQSAESDTVLGRQYGVTGAAIKSVKEGRSWGHVTSKIPPTDVFNFPRVTGNSKQRRKYHPTQLHEGLVDRCVRLSTLEGEWVVDPFGGTGTTMRVCKEANRSCTLIEIDPDYCEKIAEEHNLKLVENGDKYKRWKLV